MFKFLFCVAIAFDVFVNFALFQSLSASTVSVPSVCSVGFSFG